MLKKFVVGSLVCLGLLGLLAAGRSIAEEPTPTAEEPAPQTVAPEADAPVCPVASEPDQDAIATDPPTSEAVSPPGTCGTCPGQCSSDSLCKGKQLGDRCGPANTKICEARDGCAMYNCCYCAD